jgi:hypothetical protein
MHHLLSDASNSDYLEADLKELIRSHLQQGKKRPHPGLLLSSDCLKEVDEKGCIWVLTIPLHLIDIVWKKMKCLMETHDMPEIWLSITSLADFIYRSQFFIEAEPEPTRVSLSEADLHLL